MSDCVIISGTLEAKFKNKLFAYFHQRYVELVYVEDIDNNNNDTSIGHYEMRLYKNKNKTESPLYSFIINPISMTCYTNYMNSKQHKFTFVCSSQQTSICFSAHTKYERDQWISVLEQLQWQYQPNCNLSIKSKSKPSRSSSKLSKITTSKGTPVSSSRSSTSHQSTATDNIAPYDDESSDDDLYMNYNEYETKNLESISYIISLTEKESNYDNNYYYNYYQSSLISTNNQSNKINHQQCTCHDCQGQKFTILGILDYSPNNNDNNINDHENKHKTTIDIDDELNFIKSPKYESIKSVSTNIPIPSIQT